MVNGVIHFLFPQCKGFNICLLTSLGIFVIYTKSIGKECPENGTDSFQKDREQNLTEISLGFLKVDFSGCLDAI